MTLRAAGVLAALGAAGSAFAQPQTQGTITYTLSYQVFAPAGPAGSPWSAATLLPQNYLEQGQGALIRLRAAMSLTPGVFDPVTQTNQGSPLTWDWTVHINSSGVGNLAGFWSGDVNLIGDGGAPSASGAWSNGSTGYAPEVRRRLLTWTAGNSGQVNGTAQGTGPASAVTDIQPAQFNADSDALNHSQSEVCWQGLWVPTSYTPRAVSFAAVMGSLGLLSNVAAMDETYVWGYTIPIALRVQTLFGPSISVQVIPGPAGASLLVMSLVLRGRRRRGRRSP